MARYDVRNKIVSHASGGKQFRKGQVISDGELPSPLISALLEEGAISPLEEAVELEEELPSELVTHLMMELTVPEMRELADRFEIDLGRIRRKEQIAEALAEGLPEDWDVFEEEDEELPEEEIQ